jgi:cell division protein FtsQ
MSRSSVAAPSRSRPPPAPDALGALRPLSAASAALRTGIVLARRWRPVRIALLAALIALPTLAGGWLLLRHSPFVSIQRVQITGVHGADATVVEAALTQAARGMSTLDVNDGALRAAVAPLRVVREVRAIPSFPHGLRIDVVEQLPVASLAVAGVRTAVAADGVVLGPGLLSGSLPSVSGSVVPAAGQRVDGATLLGELNVLGAAPSALARHVERVLTGAKGLTVAMRNGLQVYFGDDQRPRAKWLSLARVLADPGAAGASYIDVRLPSHPAAGFPAGVSPPDASTTAGAGSSEQPSTVAALAAGLPTPGAAPSAGAGEYGAATGPPTESQSSSPAPGGEASQGGEAPGEPPAASESGG